MDRIKFTEFVAHFFHSRLFLTTDVQKITGGQFNEKRNIQNNERAFFSSEKKIIVIRLSLPYISSFAYHIVSNHRVDRKEFENQIQNYETNFFCNGNHNYHRYEPSKK